MKKALQLAVSGVVAVGLSLAACGGSEPDDSGTRSVGSTAPSETAAEDLSATPQPESTAESNAETFTYSIPGGEYPQEWSITINTGSCPTTQMSATVVEVQTAGCLTIDKTLESAEFGVGTATPGFTSPLLELDYSYVYQRGDYEYDASSRLEGRCKREEGSTVSLCTYPVTFDGGDGAEIPEDVGGTVSTSAREPLEVRAGEEDGVVVAVSINNGMDGLELLGFLPLVSETATLDAPTVSQALNLRGQ